MGPESANPPNQVGSNTPFRGNILNFTVGEGASAQTVPVYIYTTFHFMINNATPGPYRMDMRGHSLELLTNMFFRIKSVKDEDEILTPACKTRLEQFEADFSKTEPVSEVASWSLPLEFVEPNPSKDGKKPILKLNTIRHLTKLPTHSRWK